MSAAKVHIALPIFPSVAVSSLAVSSVAPTNEARGLVVPNRPNPNKQQDRAASKVVKELFVSSLERYPFSAVSGIVLRLVFPGGPDLGFFLCDLGNPTFLELVSVCSSLFGVPTLADPRRRQP
jgi:hypothetical protein